MSAVTQAAAEAPVSAVPFREALKTWAKIGLIGFGGPAGQIALMHRLLVEEKRWIGENRFLHALNYCMLLPGPEAQQLATYIGWLLHRTWGGIVAGTLFVLPGFIVMLALSLLYAGLGHTALVAGLFYGIKPAVLAIVLHALQRIARKALMTPAMTVLAGAAFVAIFFLDLPFPLIVFAAAIIGFAGSRLRPDLFRSSGGHGGKAGTADGTLDGNTDHARPSIAGTLRVLATWLPLWLGPVVVLLLWLGPDHVFSEIAVFFSKMAVVTFGGAYAVLAYVAQQAVGGFGWLKPGEMLDGLGMAETTPGPLILVLQYVGFLAAYRDPGALPPMLAGSLAAALTVWVTFTPCFLWIFLGAPYVERLRAHKALNAALSAITAAVVGVVLNLAIWFALHTLFAEVDEFTTVGIHWHLPVWASLDPFALVLAAAAILAMFRFGIGMLPTLTGAALIGAAIHLMR